MPVRPAVQSSATDTATLFSSVLGVGMLGLVGISIGIGGGMIHRDRHAVALAGRAS
jgi:hypothetical protein